MDPRVWIDNLYTYGPFAVLVLFVFYVAPKQLAAFKARGNADVAQQTLSGTIALGCWVVVFLMVFYIWQFWPPRTVYLGTLGTHPPEVQFFTQSPQLYVSSRPAGGANRLRWDYVIVAETVTLGSTDRFDFTYQWGSKPEDYKDFGLKATELKSGHIDLSPGSEPGTLMVHEDGDPGKPLIPYPPLDGGPALAAAPHGAPSTVAAGAPGEPATAGATFTTQSAVRTAAGVDTAALLEWLGSANANLRAQGRAELRKLSVAELRALLGNANGVAREQIEAELRRRR